MVNKKFMTFLKLKKKLDIDDLLKNPEKIKEIKKVDEKYALLGALSERYKKDQKILKNCLEISENLEPEFAILLLRYLFNTYKSIQKKENDYIIKFSKEILKNGGHRQITKYGKYFN